MNLLNLLDWAKRETAEIDIRKVKADKVWATVDGIYYEDGYIYVWTTPTGVAALTEEEVKMRLP